MPCQRAPVRHESRLERDIAVAIGSRRGTGTLLSQPFTLTRGNWRYTPDYLVHFLDLPPNFERRGFRAITVVEVKPYGRLRQFGRDLNAKLEWVVDVTGFGVVCLTERDLPLLYGIEGERHD